MSATLVLFLGATDNLMGVPAAGASMKPVAVRKAKLSSNIPLSRYTSTESAARSAQLWITCTRAVCAFAAIEATRAVANRSCFFILFRF